MNLDRLFIPLIVASGLFGLSVGLGTSNAWLGIAAFCGLSVTSVLLAGIIYKLECLTAKDEKEPPEREYSNRASSR